MLHILKEKGYRLTRTRQEIIKILLANPKKHLSANDLHKKLQKRHFKCDLATVYRNLNLLSRLGLIHRDNFNEPHAHYEYSHGHEIHLVCEKCGQIIEVATKARINIPSQIKFLPKREVTVITGLCSKCKRAK